MAADEQQYRPLSEILELVRQQTGNVVGRANLSAKVLAGPNGRESMLERLTRVGLARTVQRGSRQDWEVSLAAVDLIAARATGRPGKQPGAQITLDHDQVLAFAQHLTAAGSADQTTLLDAIRVATGLPDEAVGQMERIVIPREPRRPRPRP